VNLLNFLVEHWYLVLAALTSGGLLLWPVLTRGTQGGKVTPTEAVRLINREKGVLIDVSEPAEFAAIHAAGSRSVPMGAIEKSGNLPKNKALPLVVVCPSGTRAVRAVATLKKLGFLRRDPRKHERKKYGRPGARKRFQYSKR